MCAMYGEWYINEILYPFTDDNKYNGSINDKNILISTDHLINNKKNNCDGYNIYKKYLYKIMNSYY